ncbi:uncharacterized protein BKCO1_5600046 [Diplodia corticola]|uniref:Uncharacterized protein n=1 Tax=Diplodia corticola TaxID=236234 RepID=A0A1J9QRW2_9PEZI|nr:uncharacterized protein BKCO1_5600046 [Diplodia corticola]OJD30738.1 hypothetical protein BKCO1_5600046 [Diplodia corticola]
MAAIHLKDRFEVTTHPAVITPFEDVDDPLLDADLPVQPVERDDYYIFGPPSQSSDGRYTINSHSSGRGRRFSNRTQLTEPSGPPWPWRAAPPSPPPKPPTATSPPTAAASPTPPPPPTSSPSRSATTAAATNTTTTSSSPTAEEAEDEEEDEDEEEEVLCPECHAHLPAASTATTSTNYSSSSTRWTIKTYAANGLLASPGAWAAAWAEMERVDVAITPHLTAAQHRALQREARAEREREREQRQQAEAAAKEEEQRAAAEAAAAAEEKEKEEREKEKEEERVRAAADAAAAAAAASELAAAEAAAAAAAEAAQREAEAAAEAAAKAKAEAEAERELAVAAARAEEQAAAAQRAEAVQAEVEGREQAAEAQRLRLIGDAAVAAAAERRLAEERVGREVKEAVRRERRRVREEREARLARAREAERQVSLGALVARAAWVVLADWRNWVLVVGLVWALCVGGVRETADVMEVGSRLGFDGVELLPGVGFDNVTVDLQLEKEALVLHTSTVTATATATQTSTAIVTAFVLETLSPQAPAVDEELPEEPAAADHTLGRMAAQDVEDFKDTVFAATTEILATAFAKMEAIISALPVVDEEPPAAEEASEQPASVSPSDLPPSPTPVDETESKDAVFAASTEILATAFEKMEAIIAALTEAYESETKGIQDEALLAGHDDASSSSSSVSPEAPVGDDNHESFTPPTVLDVKAVPSTDLASAAAAAVETEKVPEGTEVCSKRFDLAAYPTCAAPGTSLNNQGGVDLAYFDFAPVCSAY